MARADMGYPTKVQVIQRAKSEEFCIFLPIALARALDLRKGERVEWTVRSRSELILKRVEDRKAEP
ncbi:MAG: hypothetical protein Q8P31_10955 [Bacillota bacterium]|nr:hypothetical protein [Bacillota bacterium]